MVVAALQAGEVLSKLIVAREQVSEAAQVAAMLRAGVALPKNTFRIEYRSVDHAKQVAELGKRTASELTEALREFDTLAGQRLHLALSLLHVPKVAACVPEAREWQMRCGQLLPELEGFADPTADDIGLGTPLHGPVDLGRFFGGRRIERVACGGDHQFDG